MFLFDPFHRIEIVPQHASIGLFAVLVASRRILVLVGTFIWTAGIVWVHFIVDSFTFGDMLVVGAAATTAIATPRTQLERVGRGVVRLTTSVILIVDDFRIATLLFSILLLHIALDVFRMVLIVDFLGYLLELLQWEVLHV